MQEVVITRVVGGLVVGGRLWDCDGKWVRWKGESWFRSEMC